MNARIFHRFRLGDEDWACPDLGNCSLPILSDILLSMVALLTPGSLLGAYEIDTCIHENAALQHYAARHFFTGSDAIVVGFKHQSEFYRTTPDKRLSTILSLHEKPMKRAVPLLDGGEWESVDWAAYAPPPDDATSLCDVLMQHGALSEQCAAALVRDLLESLLASDHEHLLLRPSVLFLNADHALVAVAEHGIAELFPGAPLPFDPCIAPEARGKRFGPEADIFSCGVILYQALTGVEPFQDEGDHVARGITQDIPSITRERSDLAHAEAFDRLISMFTRKRFEDRPSILQALQEARALAAQVKAPPAAPIPHYDAVFTGDEALTHALDTGIPQSEPRPRVTPSKPSKPAPAPLALVPERKPRQPEESLCEDESSVSEESAMDAVQKAIAALQRAAEANAQQNALAASEVRADESPEAAATPSSLSSPPPASTAPPAPPAPTSPAPSESERPKRSKRSTHPAARAPSVFVSVSTSMQPKTSWMPALFVALLFILTGWNAHAPYRDRAEPSTEPARKSGQTDPSTASKLPNQSNSAPNDVPPKNIAATSTNPIDTVSPPRPKPIPAPKDGVRNVDGYVNYASSVEKQNAKADRK